MTNLRYIDDVFFTTNQSEDKVKVFLNKINNFHPNIKLECNIGYSVPFLDLLVTNHNGILVSCVYHKPTTQPCVLPFLSDHPRHVFHNVIQIPLLRAVRFSSILELFQKEYRTIRLTFLYNGLVYIFFLSLNTLKYIVLHIPSNFI